MNTRLSLTAGLVLATLASWLLAPSTYAATAAQPTAQCTSGPTRLDLRTGQGIPLPSAYANPTGSTVTFTARMSSSYFFGPAREVAKLQVQPHTGVIRHGVVPTYLHTPLGGGTVTIEVRSSATGSLVVGRCTWQVHLSAVTPASGGGPLPSAQRWTYQVPVQLCAMEGTTLAGSARSGSAVPAGKLLTTLAKVDADIWHPQGQVAFSTATDSVIPVIADPSPPNGANERLGDVTTFLADLRDVADLCREAWALRFPGRIGIPVVAVHAFVDEPATLGIAPPPPTGLQTASRLHGTGTRGDALCGSPVRLAATDVVKPFVTISDAALQGNDATKILAHELGHNLFLGHGNGLDDDADGRPAGIAGPRRYDQHCDADWLLAPNNIEVAEDANSTTPCSLMARAICSSVLRPLQIETARGVARFLPGFVNGTPTPVVTTVQ